MIYFVFITEKLAVLISPGTALGGRDTTQLSWFKLTWSPILFLFPFFPPACLPGAEGW